VTHSTPSLLISSCCARLTNEIDYDGRICGYDSEVKNSPNAYYLTTGAAVCVKNCPSKKDYYSFICMEQYQANADASYLVGWDYVAKGRCMYKVKTNECPPLSPLPDPHPSSSQT
jgi:hypothetical protein